MSRVAYHFLACLLWSCIIGGIVPARHGLLAAEDTRLPVPPQEKVEESLALIRDAYERDYQAAKESGEPEQLIAQLITLADQEADPVRKYALLVEAENVAATHDNYKKAVDLLDTRADLFRVDGLAIRGDLLKRLAGPRVSADLELCDQAMNAAQQAMQSERFDLASDAATLALGIAKAIDREQKAAARKQRKKNGGNFVAPPAIGGDLLKKATALQLQVTAKQKLFEQYSDAEEKAKKSPDSPSANTVVGSYLCFVRGDWESGLPALVKGSTAPFGEIAAEELKVMAATVRQPQQIFELAGKWWGAAEGKFVADDQSEMIKDHAAGLYEVVFASLTDPLERRVAESRIRSRPKQLRGARNDREFPAKPLRVAVNGLGGKRYVDPETFGPDWLGFNPKCSGAEKAWVKEGAFACMASKGSLAWPAVKVSRYVCEFEVTFPAQQDGLRMCFGDPWDATQLFFAYKQDRKMFQGELLCWRHGGWWWWGHHDFAPQEKHSFKLVVSDGRQSLFESGKPVLRLEAWATDSRLRIVSDGGGAIIHSLSFRPLTQADAQECGWEMPPSTVDGQPAIAARRLAQLMDGLSEKPAVGKRCKAALVGSPLAWIEPGTFQMGSSRPDDVRRQTVTLTKGFWIGQTEVTQREYRQVMGINPSRIGGSEYLPVDWVAWEDCEAFCRKLNDAARKAGTLPTGYEYRLPTEAEWEYACRAGSSKDYSTSPVSVWDRDRSGRRPREVAESEPNAWGLFDMHGNAMEWCRDRWYDYPGRTTVSETDPYRPGKPTAESFVVRGGAWWLAADTCTSHWRSLCTNTPAGGYRGFRIAIAPVQEVILDKTLVAWTTVKNLGQRGGGVLSIEDPRNEFDAIVFGEAVPFRWTIGCDWGKRGCPTPERVALEDAKPAQLVQIAIVYSGSSIALYRNGVESVQYEKGPPVPYRVADTSVLLGTRHIPIPGNGLFAGEIDDARIYDVALTAEQIRGLVPNKITGPKPLGWWHFEDGRISDATGTFPKSQAFGSASVRGGRLVLDGRDGFVVCRQAAPPESEDVLKEQLVVDFLAPGSKPGTNGLPANGEPLDLLEIVDPPRDTVWGAWKRIDGELESGGERDARIRFPVRPPREYEFTVEFTRLSGQECVGQCCTADGQGFFCMLGGHRNTLAGLERVDWRDVAGNTSTQRRANWITNGTRHNSTVRVRRDRVEILFDGQKIISMPVDWSGVSYHPAWQIPDTMLGLGTWQSPTRFHRATVTDIGRAVE
jgi:formylglycine-generating enzyme required for sulfatase activity